MAEHGNEDAVRVPRVNRQIRDLLPVAQSQMTPRAAGIGGSIDPIAYGEIGAVQSFTTSVRWVVITVGGSTTV